ncbi:MAG TPA: Rieske 2Fe-2S domain-containing protein [Dehalococcoidia bacterium]|nr:Rieske 2Fe-2S domain-containing protein [Dehalococcoidia bacterium]
MPSAIVVASIERPVLGFALERMISFLVKGTKEQQEIADSLAQMLTGLEATPAGAVEMEFLEQDAYLLGIRIFYASAELEDFWLDACERASGHETEPPDPELEGAVSKYFPELVDNPRGWNYEPVRGSFIDLGVKLDRIVTELAPRARAIYNSDREEMSDRAIAVREENARRRSARTGVAPLPPEPETAVATAERPTPASFDWGVEFSTGLSPDDIPMNSFRTLTVGSVRVLITRYNGELGAIDGTCTHQHANLTKGTVEETSIECGRHGATFDLRTGEQICPPFCQKWLDRHGAIGSLVALITPDKKGGDLQRFPLRVENDEIILRV